MAVTKIVLTGPESTGKSILSSQLAGHFNGELIPEYARQYISELNRPYTYHDLEIIARKQIHDFEIYVARQANGFLFIDTFLIITKVWFEVAYGKAPQWILDALLTSGIDLYLLCVPDIPWIEDGIRENGGEMRNWLYKEYENNLIMNNLPYRTVSGSDSARLTCAIQHVNSFITDRSITD